MTRISIAICVGLLGCNSSSSGGADSGSSSGDATLDGSTLDDGVDGAPDGTLDVGATDGGLDAGDSPDLALDLGQTDGEAPDANPPDVEADTSPPDPPDCPPVDREGPIITLEWGAVWETTLLTLDAEALVLDDLVFPRPRTLGARVEGLVPAQDPLETQAACLDSVAFAPLRDRGLDDVALVDVIAVEPDGAERRGRVSWLAAGPVLSVSPQIEPPFSPQWLLFEPATLPARLSITPVSGPPPWAIQVPDVPGTLALLGDAPLRADAQTVVAPPNFASTWRSASDAWFEVEAVSWADGDIAVEPFIGPDAVRVPLGESPVTFENPVRLAVVTGLSQRFELVAPCDGPLRISASGFAELSVGMQVSGPVDPILEMTCPDGAETQALTLQVDPSLPREVAIRMEVIR